MLQDKNWSVPRDDLREALSQSLGRYLELFKGSLFKQLRRQTVVFQLCRSGRLRYWSLHLSKMKSLFYIRAPGAVHDGLVSWSVDFAGQHDRFI